LKTGKTSPCIPRSLFCWFLILGLQACENEIPVNGRGQAVPVVYCLLNPQSNIQYVRISRSYTGDSATWSRPPVHDSMMWDVPCSIYIEEMVGNQAGPFVWFYPDTVPEKDSGFFPVTAHAVYRAEFRPKVNTRYQLYVYFPDLDRMVSGRTWVHQPPEIIDPASIQGRTISFDTIQPYKTRWLPGNYSGLYQVLFRLHYSDSTARNYRFLTADFSSDLIFDTRYGVTLEHAMNGSRFYEAIARQVPEKSGTIREVISLEFILFAGGTDLALLYNTSTRAGTSFYGLNDFSNLTNGVGIFSSLTRSSVTNLQLSNLTLDRLAHGSMTGHLGFRDSKGN